MNLFYENTSKRLTIYNIYFIAWCPPRDGRYALLLPDITNCSRFYICSNGRAIRMDCPAGLHFNRFKKVCDYPYRAFCWAIPIKETEEVTQSQVE